MPRHFQRPFELPDGATEMVLVRHGAAGRPTPGPLVGGHSDPPLSPRGVVQAGALVARLAHEPVAALFVTPLRRTAETAAPLGAALGLEPEIVHEMREVHLGAWEGEFQQRVSADDAIMQRVFEQERWDLIPGAEPQDAFARRIAAGLEHMAGRAGRNGVALAVVHGGVIAEACRQATGSRPFAFLTSENASITRLVRLADGRWSLRSFNDTAHLPASAPSAAA